MPGPAILGGVPACTVEQKPKTTPVAPGGIDEEGYVRIGGIDQWIQIRGDHRENPVLLWLNGGPGFSVIPSTAAYRAWEKVFAVGHLAIFTAPDAFLTELVRHARNFAVSK